MTTEQKVTPPKRRTRAEVQRLVSEFAGSGMGRTEFCRSRQLGLSTLDRHLRKLKARGRKQRLLQTPAVSRLVPVELANERQVQPTSSCGLSVVLSGGRRIEVQRDFDAPTFKRLLSVLEPA